MRKLGILIFEDVEVLDFCGPFEVFAVTREPQTMTDLFEVSIIAEHKQPVIARNGLSVNPHYSLEDCPTLDMLLVPGGRGTRTLIHNEKVMDWVRAQGQTVELLLSVCTGSLVLAKAGLLAGLSATTYHTAFDDLRTIDDSVTLCPGKRYVDNGRIITSAGISAGIDMSLYVIEKLHGAAQAQWTADHMEYEYYTKQINA